VQALRLYTYCRSSAAFRVRIALNMKGLVYRSEFVHLLKGGGEQFSEAYSEINPQRLVPSLSRGDDTLTQSLAIIEYLEEVQPKPALLPAAPLERAAVRALALSIACDIHPLDNLRVMRYLEHQLGLAKDERERWYCHWLSEGLAALEVSLRANSVVGLGAKAGASYCHGEQAGLADICLIPQVYNALRFNCSLADFPIIEQIYEHCMGLAEFHRAAPEQQADFVEMP